jgi:hypothetical protein
MKLERVVPMLVLLLMACEGEKEPQPAARLSVPELKDPETCKSCHPTHYREWKASMHAYATDDPVFAAMNKLGHQDTDGELGTFCVKCHAPMAVKDGLTDGSPERIEALPYHMKGFTCYFSHNAQDVTGENNAEVSIANDDVMRGGIVGAIQPSAHGVAYSKFMNRYDEHSSQLCGGCHDIVNDHGVHLERTFAEYKRSVFSHAGTPGFLTCSGCHMPNREGLAAIDGAPALATRDVHSHLWPGVDVALTSWPDREEYEAAVTCALDNSILVKAEQSDTPGDINYWVENIAAHNMPSGASQDRRLWVEVREFDRDDNPMCTLGAVPDDEQVVGFREPGITCARSGGETSFPLFRDRIFDENGEETHNFWEAAPSDASEAGYVGSALEPATMVDAQGNVLAHTTKLQFTPQTQTKRVEIRMRMRPMDYDVLGELIDAGVLDDAVRSEIRTYTLATATVEYRFDDAQGIWIGERKPERATNCYDVNFCAFDSEAPGCAQP